MQREPFVSSPESQAEFWPTSITNLPTQLTSLIGREQDVNVVCTLLQRPDVRLLTLSGPGGVGKTRLALQAATNLLHLDSFTDGVYFVPLASVSNPDVVIPTIAQVLGLSDTSNRSLFERLKIYLQDKHLLLLLDNFEHVVTAAPLLSELLMICPMLKILVTSRAILHIRGEHEHPVLPLPLADLKHLPNREVLSQYASVALFIQRAEAIKPSFAIIDSNAPIIAAICAHLDGLPLAIELAAARVKLLPPEALLKRLEHRLHILTSQARDVPERQQTLRKTIQWSYDLLNTEEQRLFRRMSIFVGSCTLEAVEAIYTAMGDEASNVLDRAASLVNKSLLQYIEQDETQSCFGMLETIREFGLECFEASEEIETVRRAYAQYYLTLAEEAELHLDGPQQALWLQRLEREHDNLRTALRWLLERTEKEMALRLSTALWGFWSMHGHFSEGRQWLERALAGSEGVAAPVRAKALCGTGMLAFSQGDYNRAALLCEESLTILKELGDKELIITCQQKLAEVVAAQENSSLIEVPLERALPTPSIRSTPLMPLILPTPTSIYPDKLTAREVDVLRLIATGLTDIQVAEKLVISRRTVNAHLTSIYSKIQVSSRSAAAHYAHEHKLV